MAAVPDLNIVYKLPVFNADLPALSPAGHIEQPPSDEISAFIMNLSTIPDEQHYVSLMEQLMERGKAALLTEALTPEDRRNFSDCLLGTNNVNTATIERVLDQEMGIEDTKSILTFVHRLCGALRHFSILAMRFGTEKQRMRWAAKAEMRMVLTVLLPKIKELADFVNQI